VSGHTDHRRGTEEKILKGRSCCTGGVSTAPTVKRMRLVFLKEVLYLGGRFITLTKGEKKKMLGERGKILVLLAE